MANITIKKNGKEVTRKLTFTVGDKFAIEIIKSEEDGSSLIEIKDNRGNRRYFSRKNGNHLFTVIMPETSVFGEWPLSIVLNSNSGEATTDIKIINFIDSKDSKIPLEIEKRTANEEPTTSPDNFENIIKEVETEGILRQNDHDQSVNKTNITDIEATNEAVDNMKSQEIAEKPQAIVEENEDKDIEDGSKVEVTKEEPPREIATVIEITREEPTDSFILDRLLMDNDEASDSVIVENDDRDNTNVFSMNLTEQLQDEEVITNDMNPDPEFIDIVETQEEILVAVEDQGGGEIVFLGDLSFENQVKLLKTVKNKADLGRIEPVTLTENQNNDLEIPLAEMEEIQKNNYNRLKDDGLRYISDLLKEKPSRTRDLTKAKAVDVCEWLIHALTILSDPDHPLRREYRKIRLEYLEYQRQMETIMESKRAQDPLSVLVGLNDRSIRSLNREGIQTVGQLVQHQLVDLIELEADPEKPLLPKLWLANAKSYLQVTMKF